MLNSLWWRCEMCKGCRIVLQGLCSGNGKEHQVVLRALNANFSIAYNRVVFSTIFGRAQSHDSPDVLIHVICERWIWLCHSQMHDMKYWHYAFIVLVLDWSVWSDQPAHSGDIWPQYIFTRIQQRCFVPGSWLLESESESTQQCRRNVTCHREDFMNI